jgi:hypothetical protein
MIGEFNNISYMIVFFFFFFLNFYFVDLFLNIPFLIDLHFFPTARFLWKAFYRIFAR